RVHPLHPQQPLCPTCALPLCTSLLPSPLAEGAKNASKESAARNNTATPTAAVVTPDEADESDDDDADADLGSSAVEVTITILVPDTDDDGWPALAHQAPSSLSSAADVDEAQQAAIQRQRAMARTVGGHRPLANPRLEAGSRPTYTARKKREARRAEQHRRASTDTPTRERNPKLGRMVRRVPLAQPTAGHEPFETLVAVEVHSGEGDVTPEDGGAAARRFLC
ncbi:hypothetical protein CF336_g8226, partial [Tilletia laevis]